MSHQQEGISQVPQGAGQWSTGSVVREIEGHFNKNNEPQNAAPIDHTGGVPGVDYKQRAKDALTGHHGSSTQDSSRTSGGVGSGSTGLGSSSTRSGAEYGSGTGTGISAAGAPSGLSSGTGATGTGLASNTTTSGGLGSGTGTSGRHGVPESDRLGSDNLASNHPTGHGGVGTTLTPGGERGTTSSTSGATQGIPERAEHALDSRGTSNTGDHAVGTTGAHTGSAGRGGVQQELSQSVGKGGAVGGTTGAGTGAGGLVGPGAVAGGAKHTGDVSGGRTSLDNTSTGAHNTHNTSGTASPKKEGLLAKIKHVVSKE